MCKILTLNEKTDRLTRTESQGFQAGQIQPKLSSFPLALSAVEPCSE